VTPKLLIASLWPCNKNEKKIKPIERAEFQNLLDSCVRGDGRREVLLTVKLRGEVRSLRSQTFTTFDAPPKYTNLLSRLGPNKIAFAPPPDALADAPPYKAFFRVMCSRMVRLTA
jgi:hypothetical protein